MIEKKIKGGRITNLTDARYFAAWGAEWLGFSMDINSGDYILPDDVILIKEWIDGCKITLEFGNQEFDEIQVLVNEIKPHAIEIPIQNYSTECDYLGVELILKISSFSDISSIFINPNIYFFIDFGALKLNWVDIKANLELLNLLISLAKQVNIILDLDFGIENIEEIMSTIPSYAINLKGGEEEKIGYKSFENLDEILETLED